MNLKKNSLLGFLFLSNIMHCSDPSDQFKALSVSNDPRLRHATKEDITALREGCSPDILWSEQLNHPFSRYVTEYNHCKWQKSLANFGALALTGYSGIILSISCLNDKATEGIVAATTFGAAAYKIRSLAKDYAHDQELLINKCCKAFDQEHLIILRRYYSYLHASKHLDFLNLVAARKEWVNESQQ
jgi:hypothetical protein